MAKYSSKNALLMIDVSATPTAVLNVNSFDIEVSGDPIDVSDMASDWKETLEGQKSWKGSAEVSWDPAAGTAQETLETALFAGNTIEVTIRPRGTGATYPQLAGTARITSFKWSGAKGEAVKASIEFEGTGPLDNATQSGS